MNRSGSPSASQIQSAMSNSSSVTGSSIASQQDSSGAQDPPLLRRAASAHGLERQLHPSNRRSGIKSKTSPLSLEDKANRDQAGVILISRLCAHNCWPRANAKRGKDVEESLLQANALASRQNRPTTLLSKSILDRVCHNGL